MQRRSLRSGVIKDRQEEDQTDIGLFVNRVHLLPHLRAKVRRDKQEGKMKNNQTALAP